MNNLRGDRNRYLSPAIRNRNAPRVYLITAVAALAFIMAAAMYFGRALLDQARAKETITTMAKLSTIIGAHQPTEVSRTELKKVISDAGVTSVGLEDGWGRPLLVSVVREDPSGKRVYSIRSLGRDGVRGACCDRVQENLDEDALIEGEYWKQVWDL